MSFLTKYIKILTQVTFLYQARKAGNQSTAFSSFLLLLPYTSPLEAMFLYKTFPFACPCFRFFSNKPKGRFIFLLYIFLLHVEEAQPFIQSSGLFFSLSEAFKSKEEKQEAKGETAIKFLLLFPRSLQTSNTQKRYRDTLQFRIPGSTLASLFLSGEFPQMRRGYTKSPKQSA